MPKHFTRVNSDTGIYFPPDMEWGTREWLSYLCCGSFTLSKTTEYESEVTCKNCLRELRRNKMIITPEMIEDVQF